MHPNRKAMAIFSPLSVSRPQCKIQRKFAFLKTHKTGSSSVQNILYRFALKHRLRALLAPHGKRIVKLKKVRQ